MGLKTAASVTGYAYLADIAFSIIGIIVSWYLVPTFRIDIKDLALAAKNYGKTDP